MGGVIGVIALGGVLVISPNAYANEGTVDGFARIEATVQLALCFQQQMHGVGQSDHKHQAQQPKPLEL